MSTSPLQKMVAETPTALWNDSCSQSELAYALAHGAVGATANPVIIGTVLQQEMDAWRDVILKLIADMPDAGEDAIAWSLMQRISAQAAQLLIPAFEASGGRNGRLSIQTDPRNYRDASSMVDQAVAFSQMAPNMIVKIPATRAGIEAIEEATYRGVSINATVSFSVPQALAVGEAVERGLERRENEGLDIASMGPVCTIMVGRLDDWLKVWVQDAGLLIDPGCLEWAGVAAMKRAYAIYQQRGYRLRLLSAAFRNHMHWSQFTGGDVVISPPHKWQVLFNESSIPVLPRMDDPVDPRILSELASLDEFQRSYEPDGMSTEEFDSYGATRRTLLQFLEGYRDFVSVIRGFMLPAW